MAYGLLPGVVRVWLLSKGFLKMIPSGRLGRAMGRAKTERASDVVNAGTTVLLDIMDDTGHEMSVLTVLTVPSPLRLCLQRGYNGSYTTASVLR